MNFFKVHSFGNDFIIFEGSHRWSERRLSAVSRRVCSRHTGIGADGCLVTYYPKSKQADFGVLIANADGSIAKMCGNGLRCLAQYLFQRQLLKKTTFFVETAAGIVGIELFLKKKQIHTINLDLRDLHPSPTSTLFEALPPYLRLANQRIYLTPLMVGVPHLIAWSEICHPELLATVVCRLNQRRLFPDGINLSLAKILNRHTLELLTHERGVGLTMACGTGAVAAAYAARLVHQFDSPVRVKFPLGEFLVKIDLASTGSVQLIGPPAKLICEGTTFV